MSNTKKTVLPRSEKPTLKTISQLSGLAVPTVSRALNDAPDIGQATKEKVRRIADEIGYVPNRAGVRLRTGRTNVISLVLSTEHDMMNHTARLISSIAGALQDTPFHMIVTPYFPSEDPMRPVRHIVETGLADAIILNQIQPDDPRIAYMLERNFPFASHGRTNNCENYPYYDYDNRMFGRISGHKLHRRGRRTIAMIAPPRQHNYGIHMIEGLTEATSLHGMSLDIVEALTSDSASAEISAYVTDLLRERPEIDGIVTSSASAAMASVAGLEAVGREVGTSIDVFAKEAIPFLKLFRADIQTVAEDVRKAGQFLAQAAIQAVRQPELPPMQGLDIPEDTV